MSGKQGQAGQLVTQMQITQLRSGDITQDDLETADLCGMVG